MIIALILATLSAFITIAIGAISLHAAKRIVITWVRFYTSLVPPHMSERRYAEVLSDIHDQITLYTLQNYRPAEIAQILMYRWVMGLKDDVSWCAPYTPAVLVDKATKLSQSLWTLRKSKMAVPAIAVFGLTNYAFLNSNSERTWMLWLGINTMTTAMVILLSQQHRVWARRILFTWVGAGGIITLGYMAWWIGPYKLYEMMQLPMTRGFLLVLATFSLAMIVVDKSFRTRFLKARWRYVVICWLLIITVSLVTSIFLAGSVEPFLSALAVVAGFVAVLFIFGGVIALLATALWYGCLKGSVIMLQVVAAGLRHIK